MPSLAHTLCAIVHNNLKLETIHHSTMGQSACSLHVCHINHERRHKTARNTEPLHSMFFCLFFHLEDSHGTGPSLRRHAAAAQHCCACRGARAHPPAQVGGIIDVLLKPPESNPLHCQPTVPAFRMCSITSPQGALHKQNTHDLSLCAVPPTFVPCGRP